MILFLKTKHAIFLTAVALYGQAQGISQNFCVPRGFPDLKTTVNYSKKKLEINSYTIGFSLASLTSFSEEEKIPVGAEVRIVRCLPPGRFVSLAQGTVQRINGRQVEAYVKSAEVDPLLWKFPEGELAAQANLFPKPMVGDFVVPLLQNVSRRLRITPKLTYPLEEIFENEKDFNNSYNISSEGELLLKQALTHFEKIRGRLAVEVFLNQEGDREALRLQSLIRAQAVASHLRRVAHLKEDQVIPIGIGSDGLESGLQTVEFGDRVESGVTLKILPHD